MLTRNRLLYRHENYLNKCVTARLMENREAEKRVSRLVNELKKIQTVSTILASLHEIRNLLTEEMKLSKSCQSNISITLTPLAMENSNPLIAKEAALILTRIDSPWELPVSLTVRSLQYCRLRVAFSSSVPVAAIVRCVASVVPSLLLR